MSEATPAPESPVTEPVTPPDVPTAPDNPEAPSPSEPAPPPTAPEPEAPPETQPSASLPNEAPAPAVQPSFVTSIGTELSDLAAGIKNIAASMPHPGVVDSDANASKLREYAERIRQIAQDL